MGELARLIPLTGGMVATVMAGTWELFIRTTLRRASPGLSDEVLLLVTRLVGFALSACILPAMQLK